MNETNELEYSETEIKPNVKKKKNIEKQSKHGTENANPVYVSRTVDSYECRNVRN